MPSSPAFERMDVDDGYVTPNNGEAATADAHDDDPPVMDKEIPHDMRTGSRDWREDEPRAAGEDKANETEAPSDDVEDHMPTSSASLTGPVDAAATIADDHSLEESVNVPAADTLPKCLNVARNTSADSAADEDDDVVLLEASEDTSSGVPQTVKVLVTRLHGYELHECSIRRVMHEKMLNCEVVNCYIECVRRLIWYI